MSDYDIDLANERALLSLDRLKLAGPELAEPWPVPTCSVIGCPNQQAAGDLCTEHADAVRAQPFEAS